MTIIDKNGIEFFERELIEDTNRQLMILEKAGRNNTLGLARLRLYEEKAHIRNHFKEADPNLGAFLSNCPAHALFGPSEIGSSVLAWEEKEGLRHSVFWRIDASLAWEEKKPPAIRLTKEGELRKRINIA